MNLGFGTPMLLWGCALVAAPILIHLLNRRRYVVRPFAAMEFLRQAYARRRRRMRMENLLLLLLRCLAVILAALAMALPFVSSDSPLALLTGGSRDVVLIIDRSGSTGRTLPGGASLSDRVLEMARRQVARLSADRGDAVTIITPGTADLLPSPIGASPTVALAALDDGLPDPGGVADMVGAARLVRDRVRPVHRGRLDIEILTDMQQVSWLEDVGPLFAEILDDGGGSLRIVDVASDLAAVSNLGVESLTVAEPLLVAGEIMTFTATIVNHADVARRGLEGTFTLDGGKLQRKLHDIEVPARGRVPVPLRLRVDDPGSHHLAFALEPDELPFDDERTLAFEVSEVVDVLLVDGDHSGSPLDRATAFLELALDPGLGLDSGDDLRPSTFRAHVVDPRSFEEAGSDLFRYDIIVLADVGGVTAEAAAALLEVVQSGTPLLVFTGERVVPRIYAERLGALMPATLGATRGDPGGGGESDYVTLALADPPPPELALFADPRLAVLLQVPVLAWHELQPVEGAEVLASFADALGHTTPAIVARDVGFGRCILVGTSADDSWSLLPRNPATWLPFVHELVGNLVAADPALTNVPLGQGPSLIVDGRPSKGRLEFGSGSMIDIGRPELLPLGQLGQRSVLSLEATPLVQAGGWTLVLEFADQARPARSVALSALPDAREGDLRRIDESTLRERLAGVDFVIGERIDEASGGDDDDGGDGSLFGAVLWALLVCLLAESLLARSIGGQR